MRWLALFYFLAFLGGDSLLFLFAPDRSGSKFSLPDQWVGLTSTFVFFELIFAGAATVPAALLRSKLGRLSSFLASAVGVLGSLTILATVMNLFFGGPGMGRADGWILGGAVRFFEPFLLSFVPVFRTRALRGLPVGAPRMLDGSWVVGLSEGSSVAATIGGRPAGEARWACYGLRPPRRWDDSIARLKVAVRALPVPLALAIMLSGRSRIGWWCLAAACLVAAGAIALWKALGSRSFDVQYLVVLLLFVVFGLSIAGVRRLVEAWGSLRLLRTGEVVMAIPEPNIFTRRANIVTTVRTPSWGVALETPRPEVVGSRQGLLVGQGFRGRLTFAPWDRLPIVPSVTRDGSLAAPPMMGVIPRLAGPLVALASAAFLAIYLARSF